MVNTKGHFSPHPNDIIIIVMGPTGSGKTNLINNFTGNPETHRAGGLASDTQNVIPYPIMRGDLRFVLVDTPGFDDTYRPDSEILRTIADWVTQKYPDTKTTLKSRGIIYVHRITDKRMSGSARKNLRMFGRLCGDTSLSRTRLVTTMWDQVRDKTQAESRESELRNEFWKPLLQGGAQMKRFENAPGSTEGIVQDIVQLKPEDNDLLLQEELVEQRKRLNETEAGKVLYNRLQQLLAEQRRTLKELAEEAKVQNDPILARSLQEDYDKIDAQLQKTFEDIKEMKIPLSRVILLWLFSRKSRGKAIVLG